MEEELLRVKDSLHSLQALFLFAAEILVELENPLELPPPQKKSRRGGIAATLIAILLILILLLFSLPYLTNFASFLNFLSNDAGSRGTYTTTYHFGSGGDNASTLAARNPLISSSSVQLTYPQDYSTLENYSLSVINKDRSGSNLGPVVASSIPSAQQHADSMLYFGYFSHWDTQGLKPYMRYSLLNGTGFVEENVAYEYTTLPSYLSTGSVERAISNLEYQMMYNDSLCCQNGHRENILNPTHDRVSLGIAYDTTHVYFVEDFESNYLNLETPIARGGGSNIVFSGSALQQAAVNPNSILIFYDNSPQELSASTLNSNYSGPYGQGNFIGGVLPPCQTLFSCASYQGYTTVYAGTWNVQGASVNIAFSLSSFVNKYGPGVYTLYMVQGNNNNPEYLTSISIFVS